jgi:hypothetical protein
VRERVTVIQMLTVRVMVIRMRSVINSVTAKMKEKEMARRKMKVINSNSEIVTDWKMMTGINSNLEKDLVTVMNLVKVKKRATSSVIPMNSVRVMNLD